MLTALALSACVAIGCSSSDAEQRGRREPSSAGAEHAVSEGDRALGAAREAPRASARVVIEPPGREPAVVNVEVARTPAETQRGLMFRRHMEPDAGMIFLFPRPRHLTFWMHNTYIPLDMVFITSDMRVLGVVENATPETDDAREVDGESQFVLEVNAGYAREHGITAGAAVRFEGVSAAPAADEGSDDEWEDEE